MICSLFVTSLKCSCKSTVSFFFYNVPLLFRTLTRIALVSGWISQQGLAFWTCSTPYLQKPLRVSTWSLLGMRRTSKHHIPLKLKNMVRTRNQLLYAIQYWSAIYLVIFFLMSLLVLPKYEVNINFPTVITTLDKEVTLKVCAK